MSETDGSSAKTCFVAMPITTPASYAEKLGDSDHFAHVLTHLFTPALQAAGLAVIPPSVSGSEIIHAEIIKNLEQADFLLCDLSDLNPNVLFELGIRTSLDRPVILVRDNLTAKIPFDINAINTVTYDSSLTPWSLAAEIPRLTTFFQGVVKSGNPGNAMWRYFGLTKRGAPSDAGANPVEDKLDLIIRELAKGGQYSTRITAEKIGALFFSGDEGRSSILELIRPVLARHGITRFGIGAIEHDSNFGPTLRISIPSDTVPTALMDSEIRQVFIDNGFDKVTPEWVGVATL